MVQAGSERAARRRRIHNAISAIIEQVERRTLLSATSYDLGEAVVTLNDGSIVVAGTSLDLQPNAQPLVAFAKYDAAGVLQTVNVLNFTAFIDEMTLDDQGRIVAAGSVGSHFAVMRFTPSLTLDTSFDGDGIAVAFAPGSQARDLVVQPDGKIVVVGQAYDDTTGTYDIGVARFTAIGALDDTFGDVVVGATRSGTTTADMFAATGVMFGSEEATSVDLDASGRIVVAAAVPLGIDNAFGVARFTAAGDVDVTFGAAASAGLVYTEVSPGFESDRVAGVQVLSDGRIVVAGTAFFQSSVGLDSVALVSYNENGSLDTTFGSGFFYDESTPVIPPNSGISVHLLDTAPTNDGLSLRADARALELIGNRLIVGATVTQTNGTVSGETEVGLFGFTLDGHRDQTFGEDGDLHAGVFLYDQGNLAQFDAVDDVRGMAITASHILVAGTTASAAPNDFLLVQFGLNGQPGGGTNLPPTGTGGGPYQVDEGASVLLTASGSDPEDGPSCTFKWDLDDDGVFESSGQSVSFMPAISGPATLTRNVQISDSGGQTFVASAQISINNVAPTVVAGPDVGGVEGTAVSVTMVSATDVPVDGTLVIAWKVELGSTLIASGIGGLANFVPVDNGAYVVTFTAMDDDGGIGSDSLLVTVANADPVAQLQMNAGQLTPVRQWEVAMTGSSTDAGTADTHTYAWQVFDAASALVASGTGTNVKFTPVSGGTHTVTLIVTDDDGGTGSIDVPVVVNTHWLDPDGVLRVGGTSGNDDIDVATNSLGNVRVFFSGASAGPASAASRVIVRAGSGRDSVTVAEGVPRQTSVHGGAGADTLQSSSAGDLLFGEGGSDSLLGNAGADILVGGDGNDLVVGGKGDDLLIGGRGADSIVGNQNDDIIVGGWTLHDSVPAALQQVLRTWQRRADYDSGVASLRVAGVLLEDVDVFDDNARDVMTGEGGLDVFYGNFSRPTSTLDVITDLKAAEFALDLDLILPLEA